jgi:dihydroneopterin aldolase
MDSVFVRSLTVHAILGVNPDERVTPQPVLISFVLAVDTRAAGASDDIDDAVDYAKAAERVATLTREGKFQLAEALAEHLAAMLLAEFPADLVRVEVEKPEALADAASVGVSIERRRSR